MRRFCIAVFNRATYSRCKSLIEACGDDPEVSLTVALSSSLLMEEFGNAQDYIRGQGHPRTRFVLIPIEYADRSLFGSCHASAQILADFAKYFSGNQFDAVIVVADRFETLPVSIAASYQNIPVIHIQGGEVTSNIDEKVRWAVSRMADYHFVATTQARKYLLESGEHHYRVFKTGCPSLDLIPNNFIRRRRTKEKYLISIFHPETKRLDEAVEQTKAVLAAVLEYCQREGYRCHWYWPNPDPGREQIAEILEVALKENPTFLVKAVNHEPEIFLRRLAKTRMVIGNSSCGIREASYLGVPTVNIGERQSFRERSDNVIDADYDHKSIVGAMFNHPWRYGKTGRCKLYGDGKAAARILHHLKNLEFSLKEPVTYPLMHKFREAHIGSARFKTHRKRIYGRRTDTKEKLLHP